MGNKFLGIVDPNAILRGEITANPGDTFVAESLDKGGCVACVFEPGCREGVGGWGNFRLLHAGLRSKCLEVAEAFHVGQTGDIVTENIRIQRAPGPKL